MKLSSIWTLSLTHLQSFIQLITSQDESSLIFRMSDGIKRALMFILHQSRRAAIKVISFLSRVAETVVFSNIQLSLPS